MGYRYAAFATYPDRDTAQSAIVELSDCGLGAAKALANSCHTRSADNVCISASRTICCLSLR